MNFVNHLHAKAALADALDRLNSRKSGQIVAFIGIAGVGKSTIRRLAFRTIFGHPRCFLGGRLPLVDMLADLSDKAFYNPKSFARRFADEFIRPDMEWLKPLPGEGPGLYEQMVAAVEAARELLKPMIRTPRSEPDYWDNVKGLARDRGLEVLSLDHCNSLLVNRKDTQPAQHAQHLMSVCERISLAMVLTGVPSAVKLWQGYPELRRRVKYVWVMNYSLRDAREKAAYGSVLMTVWHGIKTKPTNLLAMMGVEIVAATGGSFDEICNLRDGAVGNSAKAGRDHVTRQDIEDSYLTHEDIKEIWEAVREFDAAKVGASSSELLDVMNTYMPNQTEAPDPNEVPSKPKTKRKGVSRNGTKKPKRGHKKVKRRGHLKRSQ